MRPNLQLIALPAAAALLAAGWAVHWSGGPDWLRATLLAASAVLSSLETFPEALRLIRALTLDIDALMFTAALGAASLGHYEEAALLLFLFGLGHAGEDLAAGRSRKAIESLTRLTPDVALRIDADGNEQSIPLAQVRLDDRVRIRPFDRVSVDGVIEEGMSDLDESSLTGESVPVTRDVGELVYAGTMNGGGRLLVRVTRLAGESTLARIIRLVEEARSQKSPTQLFTDRVERVYVPCVFVLTLLVIIVPPLVGWTPRMSPQSPWGGWFYQAMAFLTAASPCALAIGTPTAILCGIAHGARVGILIKGGAHLEMLGRLRAVALDKTGTITTGRPRVERVETVDGITVAEAMRLAAAVDRHTSHPFAAAIVQAEAAARTSGIPSTNGHLPDVADLRQLPGEGASGVIDGRRIAVGKSSLAAHHEAWPERLRDAHASLQGAGCATTIVTRDAQPIAVIGLIDSPRPEAADTVQRLRAAGVEHVVMLTGDHVAVAHAVAERIGIAPADVHADLLPQQKLEQVDALVARYGTVAMVGDGVNDAPALAKASLGIAIGAAAGQPVRSAGSPIAGDAGAHANRTSDVAIETADVVLLGQDLRRLADAVDLGRRARSIILQNLVLALGVIALVAPLAALGYARLGWAVLLHEGSTVVVVLNGMRLLRAPLR